MISNNTGLPVDSVKVYFWYKAALHKDINAVPTSLSRYYSLI